ncbi:MAG: chemotaxis protein CheZ [Zetaproteobacteria bacterium]|nr:MAG: chemotaxis protein CheZ [Zetaproteobacteria bacterium]
MSDVSVKKTTVVGGKKDRIVALISSVVSKVEQDEKVSLTEIMTELRDLLLVIEETRIDLGMARPTDITGEHIPGATDELDAIIDATSEATGTIMDCCDVIQERAGEVGGEQADAITAEVMKIFEACSFQDITGQRVSKVVKTFRDIEEKIDKLVCALGVKTADILPEDTREGDDALMNGPQLASKAISQEDIDKLMAELDGVSE